MTIRVKRAYDPPSAADGFRVLVDRLWPRGLSKEKLKLDAWMKDVAPSNELRKRYHHDPAKWEEFQEQYFEELADQPDAIAALRKKARAGVVTLLYGARDESNNNAVALKNYLSPRRK